MDVLWTCFRRFRSNWPHLSRVANDVMACRCWFLLREVIAKLVPMVADQPTLRHLFAQLLQIWEDSPPPLKDCHLRAHHHRIYCLDRRTYKGRGPRFRSNNHCTRRPYRRMVGWLARTNNSMN